MKSKQAVKAIENGSGKLIKQLNSSVYILASHLEAYTNILRQFSARKV